jgi:hypothetical protein
VRFATFYQEYATPIKPYSQTKILLEGNMMNEMLLIFSAGVVAGIILGILMVHD